MILGFGGSRSDADHGFLDDLFLLDLDLDLNGLLDDLFLFNLDGLLDDDRLRLAGNQGRSRGCGSAQVQKLAP
jgi:hypothetical protein